MIANSLPGFTAEASLYQTRDPYQVATSRADGSVVPISHRVFPQTKNTDLPGASCGKAPVFGNVICVQCTPGPFPKCTTYVCDQNGDNCNPVRINTQLLTASLAVKANRFLAS
jgi:hypothetical protein